MNSAAAPAGTPSVVYRARPDAPGAEQVEWLLTNGLGGFAFGTATGANTRRYHGWLIAAMKPPVDRRVVLHSIVDELVLPDRVVALATFRFGDGVLRHPDGWRNLAAFAVEPPHCARWTFVAGEVTVTRTLRLTQGENEASITYAIEGTSDEARLRLRPLVPLRDFHTLDRDSGAEEVCRATERAGVVEVTRAGYGVRIAADSSRAGAWDGDAQWWRDFAYPEERARGQDWREDVWSPGVFSFDVPAGGGTVTITASAANAAEGPPGAAARMDVPPGIVSAPADPGGVAAEQFLVRRGTATSIIAGYPWFADWGRDAMISLPGLLLTTRRFAEARSVLDLFASRLERGLLPNCFDERDGAPRYNTADAGLWFIHALRLYARASGDRDIDALVEAARAIVLAYRRGTRHGIAVGADGLLIVSDRGEPVTWMDAQRGGVTFTPRDGKPVELSALWYNALFSLADLVGGDEADTEESADLRERAGQTALAMQMYFWWPQRSCLHDVLRLGEHDWEGDARMRPNQIFSVSLPFSPLTREQQVCVVDAVRDRLLTPFGLRTLDPGDPAYCGRFEGDLMARDAAYHNGTVWPWLIGAYCDAVLRVGRDPESARAEVQAVLEPLRGEIGRGCLGQIAEVYDGDAPHRASGCPAQAWSVAEVLRHSDPWPVSKERPADESAGPSVGVGIDLERSTR